MGLIFTMHLLKRKNDLFIYGQKGLQEIIITQLKYSETVLNYNINFKTLNPAKPSLLFEDEVIEIRSFPLSHRISCCGFLFKEKPKPVRLNKENLPQNILLAHIVQLKNGEDVYDDQGKMLYSNKALTLPPRKSRSYAYCSDTKYDESILPYIQHVDLLYHEATFLQDKEAWAQQTNHSTAIQAAQIAKKAAVGTLLIGHYSARYSDLTPFLTQSRTVFDNTRLAIEGESIAIPDL